jgi:hypothetical protein
VVAVHREEEDALQELPQLVRRRQLLERVLVDPSARAMTSWWLPW